jgi:hypothetical protein
MITTWSAMERSLLMYGWVRRAIIGALALGTALGLGACSSIRLGYNQGPRLAHWWLDGYADFTGAQDEQVRAALEGFFAWHRRAELPAVDRLLAQGRAAATGPLSAEDFCRFGDEALLRRDAAVPELIARLAPIAATLTPAQRQRIARKLEERTNELREEWMPADPAEREAATLKRTVERIEDLYGRLDRGQKDWLAAQLKQSPWDPERWFRDRRERERKLLEALTLAAARGAPGSAVTATGASAPLASTKAADDAARAALTAWWRDVAEPATPEAGAYVDRLVKWNCQLSAALHERTTPAQRQTLQKKLAGWQADVKTLMAATLSGPAPMPGSPARAP